MQPFEPMLTARIIATFRLAILGIFALAILADPTQPVRATHAGYGLLVAFFAWSSLNLWAAYRDWWLDYQLARPALLIDIAAGVTSIYFTEGSPQELASPIAAFLMFVLVEAIFLGGWQLAATTGLLFAFGMIFVVLLLGLLGAPPDAVRVGRRIGFYLVITALAVWLGGRQTAPRIPLFAVDPQRRERQPVSEALEYAKLALGAPHGLVLYRSSQETSVRLLGGSQGELTWETDQAAGHLLASASKAVLVRIGRPRSLVLDEADRIVDRPAPDFAPLGLIPQGSDAIAIALASSELEAVVVLWDLRSVGRDLLPVARATGVEIEAGLNRHYLALRDVEDQLGEVRRSVARDLHDSVAQSLAGASFRVEAARRTLDAGGGAGDELEHVSEALQAEQRQVRDIIARLRAGRTTALRRDLVQDLTGLLRDLEGQWRVTIGLTAGDERLEVGTAQMHEIRQIAREAVANAAKHGGAGVIRFSLAVEEAVFHLDIVDNGNGGEGSVHPFQPRSIAERVNALGGKLDARRGPAGTRLYITVPRLSA